VGKRTLLVGPLRGEVTPIPFKSINSCIKRTRDRQGVTIQTRGRETNLCENMVVNKTRMEWLGGEGGLLCRERAHPPRPPTGKKRATNREREEEESETLESIRGMLR